MIGRGLQNLGVKIFSPGPEPSRPHAVCDFLKLLEPEAKIPPADLPKLLLSKLPSGPLLRRSGQEPVGTTGSIGR
jgi:hypothetical protein